MIFAFFSVAQSTSYYALECIYTLLLYGAENTLVLLAGTILCVSQFNNVIIDIDNGQLKSNNKTRMNKTEVAHVF